MRKYIILIASILLLAVNANAAFPVNEAGISAYVNMSQSIDFTKVADLFVLQNVTVGDTYIIGQIQGYKAKVYVGADGWVIAYLPNGTLASSLFDWTRFLTNPNANNVTNTLEDSIRMVSEAIGTNFSIIKPKIQYYNFRYPNATNMTMILETKYGIGTNEFNVLVPSNSTVYESSYNFYSAPGYYDDLIIDRITNLESSSAIKSYSLTKDFLHTIGVRVDSSSNSNSGVAWVFLT